MMSGQQAWEYLEQTFNSPNWQESISPTELNAKIEQLWRCMLTLHKHKLTPSNLIDYELYL